MPNPLKIITFDVEHGNCHIIFTPSGKVIVIDFGSSDSLSPLHWLKYSACVNTIDLLVITHPHADHIRDFEFLDNEFNIKVLNRKRNSKSLM